MLFFLVVILSRSNMVLNKAVACSARYLTRLECVCVREGPKYSCLYQSIRARVSVIAYRSICSHTHHMCTPHLCAKHSLRVSTRRLNKLQQHSHNRLLREKCLREALFLMPCYCRSGHMMRRHKKKQRYRCASNATAMRAIKQSSLVHKCRTSTRR